MHVPAHADVIVLKHRPGPELAPGDLVPERRPLPGPGPGEVVVRNLVTSVDPYQLRMLRGSPEITPVSVGEPVPANSVGVVVQSQDPAVPVGTQVATYTGWQSYVTTRVAPDEIADPELGGPWSMSSTASIARPRPWPRSSTVARPISAGGSSGSRRDRTGHE